MPLYEYRCEDCGFVFDKFRSVKGRDDAVACPECGCRGRRLQSGATMTVKKRWIPTKQGWKEG